MVLNKNFTLALTAFLVSCNSTEAVTGTKKICDKSAQFQVAQEFVEDRWPKSKRSNLSDVLIVRKGGLVSVGWYQAPEGAPFTPIVFVDPITCSVDEIRYAQ